MRVPPIVIASLALAACVDAPTSPATSDARRAAPAHASGALVSAALLDLGTLPGGTTSEALGVNDAGLVVGYSRVPSTYTTGYAERAFRWTPGGGMEELGTLSSEVGWDWARAAAVNDAGQIVGWSNAPSRYQHATLWTATGGPYDLGGLTSRGSLATAINASGQVAGFGESVAGPLHAFLWTPSTPNGTTGTIVDLGTLGGAASWADALNDAGTVVGRSQTSSGATHAFVWTATSGMIDLGTLGGTDSRATGINTQGQIVGEAMTADGVTHAFLWTPAAPGATTGTMADLGVLAGWPLGDSRARGVNDRTQVVGGDIGASAAWRWSAADGMQDLGPATSVERVAYAINENAQVAGAYTPSGGSERHAALWTVTVAPPAGPLPVAIDVAPGDATNTISLKNTSDAVLAVAVLTTPAFDAPRLVNAATARIGATPPAARKQGSLYVSAKDVDGDGDADLVIHFERAQLVANGDLTTATTSLVLRANLYDGRQVEGRDAVRVIKR